MISEIVSSRRVTRFIRHYVWSEGSYQAGSLLTMRDGSVWFHPFDGSKPVKETSH